MAEAGPELGELVLPRRDSRVRIANQDPVVIGSEGGDVWCEGVSDSSLSTSSEEGPEEAYELDAGLEESEEELERLTSRNTVRNSFSKDKDEAMEELPTVHYCQYDKKEPPPPKNNGAVPPYKVVELPPPSKAKSRPPPRPAQPPDSSRRSLPPPPASPPPPLPRGPIVVPPPPDTPPPPTPSSRTKAPPVQKESEAPIDLPKIVYEEKEGVRNTNFVPIMYASQQAPQGAQHDSKRASGGFKIKVGKLQKGMKHLRKRLTSPEAHEPPRASPGNWRAGRELPPPPPPDEDAPPADTPANEEAEEERRGRQIVTQKNVRPPKPPPPSRPAELNCNKPKPKPRLAGGLKEKICDLEDLTCLDSLFPFLSSFLLICEDAPPSPPAVPGAILDLSAQNFLLAWSERWQRRSEKASSRAKVDGPFQLGECPLQGRKFAVFEAGTEGEKLLALPPEQISPPAFSFCPPRLSTSWRPAHSESSALVAVSCCCPLDRLLALLDAADEPVAPLKRCLALAALVLALASGLPPSLPPSQVLVLLSRHDLRFLLPEPVPPSSSQPPALPPPSPLERLAPHMSGPGGEAGDLTVALEAFRGAVLPGNTEAAEWRRVAGSLLLPRLFARFGRSDFFAPFLASLLIMGDL